MPTRRRILCVDDQPEICELVGVILKDYEIVFAQSKTEGLRKARSEFFDLYLLAYFLPDGTGFELATLIRQFNDTTSVLLLVLTPRTLEDRHVSQLGLQGVVSIEDFPKKLLRKVSRLLHHPENAKSGPRTSLGAPSGRRGGSPVV